MLFAGLHFFPSERFLLHPCFTVQKGIVAGSDLIWLPEHCYAREDNAVEKEDANKRGLN